jgi:Rod binding domain-containing protein
MKVTIQPTTIAVKPPAIKLEESAATRREASLRQSSRDMEALFISQMLKAMEKTIPEAEDGQGNNLAKMMFSEVMGQHVAGHGGMGLAEVIYQGLKNKDLSELPDLNSGGSIEQWINFQGLRGSYDK